MPIICFICGQDIDAKGQDNVSKDEYPLCGSCGFIYYHSGDTTASTNLDDVHKIENDYQAEALLNRQKWLQKGGK
jgi:hypothetical protein